MNKIKSTFRFVNESQKSMFHQSHCLLTISVGQGSHESNRFASTIDLLNKSFKACTITLHDGLQRYTIALDRKEDPSYFHESSIKEGDLWLERNKKYYNQLTILKDIIRWSTWLEHPHFSHERERIITLMDQDATYKKVFDLTIEDYLARYVKRLTDMKSFDWERAKRLCFDYLVEECAVLCLWAETGCEFELYPGKHNDAVNETRKRFIFAHHPNLLQAVGIGFNQRKDLPPQRFVSVEQQEKVLESS